MGEKRYIFLLLYISNLKGMTNKTIALSTCNFSNLKLIDYHNYQRLSMENYLANGSAVTLSNLRLWRENYFYLFDIG